MAISFSARAMYKTINLDLYNLVSLVLFVFVVYLILMWPPPPPALFIKSTNLIYTNKCKWGILFSTITVLLKVSTYKQLIWGLSDRGYSRESQCQPIRGALLGH